MISISRQTGCYLLFGFSYSFSLYPITEITFSLHTIYVTCFPSLFNSICRTKPFFSVLCFKSTNWKLPFCPTRFMNLHLRCTPVNFFNMYLCRIQNRDTYITRFYCKRQFRTTQQQRIRLFFRNIFLCYL